jgi:aldehyde dehydrogenase (NAD+)
MRDRRLRAETLIRVEQERIPHLCIGGLEVEADAHGTFPVTSPADQAILGRCPVASARDVERAVDAARRAFEDGWGETAPETRAELLWRLADRLQDEADDLAILEALQTGRCFREVRQLDLPRSVAALRAFAGLARSFTGETLELGGGRLGLTLWEPHPVLGAVLSPAEPLAGAVRKVAIAGALGSSIVLKAPQEAPLGVLRLAELANEAGFPGGSINVLTGTLAQAGEALAMSSGVGVLSFSGPIDAARRALLGSAKSNLKPVHLELGGKSASIVFDDGDVRRAVQAAVRSIFSGRCLFGSSSSRLLVHEALYEEVAASVTARAKELVLGDPLDEHTELGPMPSEEHLRRVLAYVELGRREGAKLVAGGARDVDGARARGWYVRPTVFLEVRPSMRVAREDIAGPVLTISPFRNEDEALAIANDTEYGLAAGIWTSDLARAHRVARRLQAGTVWINQQGDVDPALASAGRRLSGQGRDLSTAVLRDFAQPKSIYLPLR